MVGRSTLTGAAAGAPIAAATTVSAVSATGTRSRTRRALLPFVVVRMVLSLSPHSLVGRGSPVLQTQKRLFRGNYSIRTRRFRVAGRALLRRFLHGYGRDARD